MNRAKTIELLTLTLLTAVAAAAIPLGTGYFAWSWDALNHHIYLGMIAEHPRWGLDVMPASYQTFQFPYLYWPVYRLSLIDGHGAWVGALWSGVLAALLLGPIWLVADRLLPASGLPLWQAVIERGVACLLAFLSVLTLTAVETTANDPLAALPLLWAVALTCKREVGLARGFWAAALWGVSAAFKLSNALALPWLLVWWIGGAPLANRGRLAMALAAGGGIGFLLTYGPWGWQLWQQTGNPFYPFFSKWFGV